jgi:hypothetical protein
LKGQMFEMARKIEVPKRPTNWRKPSVVVAHCHRRCEGNS